MSYYSGYGYTPKDSSSYSGAYGSNSLGTRFATANTSYGTTYPKYDRNMTISQNIDARNYDRPGRNLSYENSWTHPILFLSDQINGHKNQKPQNHIQNGHKDHFFSVDRDKN